jgi:hypothetical protein
VNVILGTAPRRPFSIGASGSSVPAAAAARPTWWLLASTDRGPRRRDRGLHRRLQSVHLPRHADQRPAGRYAVIPARVVRGQQASCGLASMSLAGHPRGSATFEFGSCVAYLRSWLVLPEVMTRVAHDGRPERHLEYQLAYRHANVQDDVIGSQVNHLQLNLSFEASMDRWSR